MNLAIVLPTYNEADNLAQMVEALLALPLEHAPTIIVVDDNSPDGTGRIADTLAQEYPGRIHVIHRPEKQGLGPAYVAGFREALDRGAELILQMDCDFSHRPEDIPSLVSAAADADLVIGSRLVAGGKVDRTWPRSRKFLSWFANAIFCRLALRLPVRDATAGFRLWHRHTLESIDFGRRLTVDGYGFQVEMAYLAHIAGHSIKEVPIYFPNRAQGTSKMSWRIAGEALLEIPRLPWRHRHFATSHEQRRTRSSQPPIGSLLGAVGTPSRQLIALGLLLCIALAVRIAGIAGTPLVPEEAYYWMYAQHPSLSYYDHPPMVAWAIGMGTSVFGDNEFGVRLVGHLLMLGASALLYLYGRSWFGRPAALLAASMLHILPVYYGVGYIATMDSALIFFWALGLVGITRALKHEQAWGWYLAGLATGGAMLSKYTGVFLAAGAALAVLAHPGWRKHLRSMHPYLSTLLAVAIFSPVVIWNAQNDWASFRFQFMDRWHESSFSLKPMLDFMANQLMILTPLLIAAMTALFLRVNRKRILLSARWLLSACMGLPLLLVIAEKSLMEGTHLNWTLPAYLSLLPGLCWMILAELRLRRRLVRGVDWAQGLRWTVAVCLIINIGFISYLIAGQSRLQLVSAFGPWQQLATTVEKYEDELEAQTGEEPLIVADGKYRLASVLAFYRSRLEVDVRAADYTTSQWILDVGRGLGYPYWAESDRWSHHPVLFVTDEDIEKIYPLFRSVRIVYDSAGTFKKRYQVAICQGFLGTGAGVQNKL